MKDKKVRATPKAKKLNKYGHFKSLQDTPLKKVVFFVPKFVKPRKGI